MKGSAAAAPTALAGHRSVVPAPGGAADMKSAPVVVVTKSEITVAGEKTDELKDAATGTGELKGLALKLAKPASADAPVIIQADQDTPATVINRIVLTIKTAGYDNVLFAVKNK
jgi:biopolymer transport protein ExbD